MRMPVRALLLAPLLLWGCAAPTPSPVDRAAAKREYMAASRSCIARYPDSLTEQSDCRAHAANIYIRPTYRYGDLMTRAQEQRRELAEAADRHEISRSQYNREVARSEAAISREEDRRNAHGDRPDRGSPFDPLAESIANLFR